MARFAPVKLPCLRHWLAPLAVCLGCSAGPAPSHPDDLQIRERVSPARVDLERLATEPGLSEREVFVQGQGVRSLTTWMPPGARPRALLIFLHGTVKEGGITGNGQTTSLVPCLVVPALGHLAPLVLAPVSRDGQWWTTEDAAFVLGLVQAASDRWPHLDARSVLLGYSNGGIGTWFFARLYPEYFTAAVPMAFNATIPGETPLPVFAIQGTRDEFFPIRGVRQVVEALQRAGRDVIYREKSGGSHFEPCNYVDELAKAGPWLEREVWESGD